MQGKKTGGRVVGSTNKAGAEIKEVFSTIVSNYMNDQWAEDFAEMTAETRAKLIIKMTEFVLAKKRDHEVTDKREKNQLQGPMGELSRMTAAQMIKARPDLVKLMLDGLKELEDKAIE